MKINLENSSLLVKKYTFFSLVALLLIGWLLLAYFWSSTIVLESNVKKVYGGWETWCDAVLIKTCDKDLNYFYSQTRNNINSGDVNFILDNLMGLK